MALPSYKLTLITEEIEYILGQIEEDLFKKYLAGIPRDIYEDSAETCAPVIGEYMSFYIDRKENDDVVRQIKSKLEISKQAADDQISGDLGQDVGYAFVGLRWVHQSRYELTIREKFNPKKINVEVSKEKIFGQNSWLYFFSISYDGNGFEFISNDGADNEEYYLVDSSGKRWDLDIREDEDEDEDHYRLALAIAEKTQGPEHPDTGTILNDLALTLREKGDYAAAEPLFLRALAISEQTQGLEHPLTGSRLEGLGILLGRMGRIDTASSFFQRAAKCFETADGNHKESGWRIYHQWGWFLREAGRLDEAEPLLVMALRIAGEIAPDHPVHLSSAISALGQLRVLQGRYDEAEELLLRVLKLRKGAESPDAKGIALVEERLATLRRLRDGERR